MEKFVLKYTPSFLIFIGLLYLGILSFLYVTSEAMPSEVVKVRIEIIKIVLASVVIGLLGILIPNKLAKEKHEADLKLATEKYQTELKLAQEKYETELKRQAFELLTEGRRLYSIVKTGLDYLPYSLPGMSYNDALAHLEKIHQAYHLVMEYPDDKKGIGKSYEAFFEDYKAFDLLTAAREIILDPEYQETQETDLRKRHNILYNKLSQTKNLNQKK